jgi:RNA polymerase sigma factor for flagellar operon FliA
MEKERELELWRELGKDRSASARQALVEHFAYLAKVNASHYYRIRLDDDVEYGDYLQYAMVGLLEAVDRYDPDRGAAFPTYAGYRIKGALLNGLEKATEQREQYAYLRRYQSARVESIANGLDHGGSDPFSRMVEATVELALSFLLEDTGFLRNDTQTTDGVFAEESMKSLSNQLEGFVERLPERERIIIRNHYYHGMAFEELATLLGISKGRISQLHKRALQMIRIEYENTERLDAHY